MYAVPFTLKSSTLPDKDKQAFIEEDYIVTSIRTSVKLYKLKITGFL